ncbi:MAG: hypothetical protein KatS3mg015_1730 [Fimbriimonadales bacterium]|nr:MAG: hypothetical protein KatS3mg015_1730 [Fimbriimonadales bacterium]
MRMTKFLVPLAATLWCLPGLAQVRTTLGPLEITVPSQYSASMQRKGSQLQFAIASPKMTVVLSTFKAPSGESAWEVLDELAHSRHKGQAEVKRTQWLGLPAVLYRLDERKGSTTQYRLVLTALDLDAAEAFQLEILFGPEVASEVQKALERWTRAVKYQRDIELRSP